MHATFHLGLLIGLVSVSRGYMVYRNGSKPTVRNHVQPPPEHEETHRQTPKPLVNSKSMDGQEHLETVEYNNNPLQNQQPVYLSNFESYKFVKEPQKPEIVKTRKPYKQSYVVDYVDSYPRYKFEYAVHDSHSGDFKSHKEERDGDVVRGSYELVEPTGARRVVRYTSDKEKGFVAVVHTEPSTFGGRGDMSGQLVQSEVGHSDVSPGVEHEMRGSARQECVEGEQQEGNSERHEQEHDDDKRDFRQQEKANSYGYTSQMTVNNQYYQPQREPQAGEEQENNKHDYEVELQVRNDNYKPQMDLNNQHYQLRQEPQDYSQQESHAEVYQQSKKVDQGYQPHMTSGKHYYQQEEPKEYGQQEYHAKVHQQNNKQHFRKQIQRKHQPQMNSNNQYYQHQQPLQESQAKEHKEDIRHQFQDLKDQDYEPQTLTDLYYQVNESPTHY